MLQARVQTCRTQPGVTLECVEDCHVRPEVGVPMLEPCSSMTT